MKRFRSLMATGLVLVLSGCGGSGFLPIMGEPLDLETALSERSAVTAVRDSLLVSDLVFAPGDSQEERIRGHTSCGRTSCLSNVLGQAYLRVSLRTAADAEASGFSAGEPIVDALERYRGVSLGAFFRTVSYTSPNGHVHVDTDILSYEGWMQYSSFEAELNTITEGFIRYGEHSQVLTGERYGLASSSGMASDTNPVDGSATWTGVMIGGRITRGATVGIGVRGHAALTYDFMNENIDVLLSNVQNAGPEVDGRRIYPNMTWHNLPVKDGRFGANFDDPTLEGRFYGPNHEEVGGIFERNQIVGAFGAKR